MSISLSEPLCPKSLEGRRRRFGWRGTRTGRLSGGVGGEIDEGARAWEEVRAVARRREYFLRVVECELNDDDGLLECVGRRVCAISCRRSQGRILSAPNISLEPAKAQEERIEAKISLMWYWSTRWVMLCVIRGGD